MVIQTIDIITRNLQEVIGQDIIKGSFEKNGTMNLYWGTAPTGRPHIAYFLPMTKIADFLKANCHVTVLFADLHAYLDNMKAPWELLQKRTEYYEILIKGMLKSLKVPLDKLRFIRGTDYQLNENYAKAVYQIIGITSIRDAAKAGCEVVKQVSDPLLSGIVYPLLQSIDEEFLGVDAQFGGVDQRKIFMYAEKYNPSLLCAKRSHLMNPMIPGLTGGKMSASEENSKIDLLDSHETVLRKLRGANCEGKTAETNGMLAFLKYIALPIKDQLENETLRRYNSSEDIEKDFENGALSEEDLKGMVGSILWSLMSPLREEFTLCNRESLIDDAYPSVIKEAQCEAVNKDYLNVVSEAQLEALKSEFPQLTDVSAESLPKIAERPVIMWSCRSSGEPHLGYTVPLRHLATMSRSNWKVVVLVEDIGAYLHSKHSQNRPSWQQMASRARLYSDVCRSMFELFGGDLNNFEVVLGSEFQLSRQYTMNLYRSISKVTEDECSKAIAMETGALSSVMYPCLSVLDQLHLGATVRLIGDRSTATIKFERTLSCRLALDSCAPLQVPHETVMALDGRPRMSSPRIVAKTAPKDQSSISLCDGGDLIARKLKKAFFDPKSLQSDPTLNIVATVVWPLLRGAPFAVKRSIENGGDVEYGSVDEMRSQLLNETLHPGDIKVAAVLHIEQVLLAPLRAAIVNLDGARSAAFPDEPPRPKKGGKKAFNPNRADMRVAVIKAVSWKHSECTVTIKVGLDRFTLGCTTGFIRLLTPGDNCIVVVRSSMATEELRLVGVLTNEDGSVLRLARRPYMDVVAFPNHEVLVSHLRETDVELVIKEIEANCVAVGTSILWAADKSVANDIELLNCCDCKIKIDRF